MHEKSNMKLYPIKACADACETLLQTPGINVYQQWICCHCGVKQTMDQANTFFTIGRCEECGQETDIKKHGMNYMIHANLKAGADGPKPC